MPLKTSDNRIYVETIDCRSVRSGNAWMIRFLKAADVANVVIDGASGQSILADEMKECRLKKPILPTVREVISANSTFEQALYGDAIRHNDQPSLSAIVTNCEKRPIGSSGGFGYKSLKPENDVAIMDSVILAYWACSIYRERRKQRISY